MSLFKKQFNIPPSGCKKSPLDKRDVLTSEISPIPKRISDNYPPPFDLTVLSQEGPSCVGFSSAAIKQEKELRERISEVFDGLWIYQKCKEIDNYSGAGTYLRIGLKILQKIGAKPKGKLELDAEKYKIGGYALVDDLSFEGLKKAIYINGVLLAGFTGSNAGWKSAYIRPPKAGEKTWGHAVALIGYNKNYIIGQNSWGEKWGGHKGLFYVPKSYFPFEAWAILTDYPTEALQFKKVQGWTALEFLRQTEFKVGDLVFPTVKNLRLRFKPMGKILGYVPQKECQILKIGEKKSGYQWVQIGF